MSVSFSNCEQETNFSWCCRMSRKCSWLKGKTSSVRGACGTMLTSWELIWVMSLTVGYPAVFMPVQHTICIGQFVMGFQSSDWLRADNQTIYKLQSCNHASVISGYPMVIRITGRQLGWRSKKFAWIWDSCSHVKKELYLHLLQSPSQYCRKFTLAGTGNINLA